MLSNFFSTLSVNTRSLLAFLITLCSFSFLFLVCFHVVPIANQNIVQMAVGFVISTIAGVSGYYFGSSNNESKAQEAKLNLEAKKVA